MAKRFSRLKYAIKTLKTSANFGNPEAAAPDAPASSILREFQNSRKNDSYGNITRSAASKQGDIILVTVRPFLRAPLDGNNAGVRASKRAMDRRTTYAGTSLNLVTEQSPYEPKFQPARVTVRDTNATGVGSAANANKVSQITGIKYNYAGGASFTFPFGRGGGTTGLNYADVKQAILTEVTNNQPARSATFKPERLP